MNRSVDLRRLRVRAAAVICAAAVALSVWALAVPVGGVELTVVTRSTGTVGPPSIVAAALVASATGWAALAVLEHLTRHAAEVWTVLALTVLMLSFSLPLNATTVAATLTLSAMHAAVGAVLIPGLALSSPAQRVTAR